jgi:hypothetical protein
MDGLLRGNWIGSGESIFYCLVQHLFAASHLQYFRRRFDITTGHTAQLPVSASVSIVATRFFTTFCTFSNELTSI